MKKLLLLLLLVTINVTAQGNPDKFRNGIKTPFTQYNELTTTQKLALPQVTGTVVYDTDLEKLQVFDGVNWVGYFNAALDTADDIIEGNTNKLLTVFERAKLDDITNDATVTIVGNNAGAASIGLDNSFYGALSGLNSTGNINSFYGFSSGQNSNGQNNSFYGRASGLNSTGNINSFYGAFSGQNAIGNSITSIGDRAGFFPQGNTLQTPNSTAIGANTIIDKANQAAIGNAAVTELKIGETLVIDKNQIVTGAEGFLVTKKVGGKTVAEVSNNFGSQNVSFAGNVGIGTTSPDSKLEVQGSTSSDKIIITNPLSASLFTSGIELRRENVLGGAKIESKRNAAVGGVGLDFLTTLDNSAELSGTYSSRMTILRNGNVGIGTTTPSYKLDVSGTGRFTGGVITGVYTVSTLPTGEKGSRAFVSDANSSTFNTVAVGGGTNNVPVFHDGTTWRIG